MTPSPQQIEERMPVWMVLSEFFLDTELQPDDHERIARTLAASRYSEQKLYDILIHEVYPICKWNMYSVAGEWAGFDPDEIREKCSPNYDRRPSFRFGFLKTWMFKHHWLIVHAMIPDIRQPSRQSSADNSVAPRP